MISNIKKQHRPKSDRIFRAIMFVVMMLLTISFIWVFLWIFANSVKTPQYYFEQPFSLIFDKQYFSLESYTTAFSVTTGRNKVGLIGMIVNTLILYAMTLFDLILGSLFGYVGAKFNSFLQRLMTTLTVIFLAIPIVGTASVTYTLIVKLGLYDTYWAVWVPAVGSLGFRYLIQRSFFKGIPWSYAESAKIDGANNLQIFFKIMLPQAIPLLIGLGVLSFISVWNDFMTAYIYLPSHPTIGLGINNLYAILASKGQNYPAFFAIMSFSILVVLIPYCFFNKTIMESMSVGGLKG